MWSELRVLHFLLTVRCLSLTYHLTLFTPWHHNAGALILNVYPPTDEGIVTKMAPSLVLCLFVLLNPKLSHKNWHILFSKYHPVTSSAAMRYNLSSYMHLGSKFSRLQCKLCYRALFVGLSCSMVFISTCLLLSLIRASSAFLSLLATQQTGPGLTMDENQQQAWKCVFIRLLMCLFLASSYSWMEKWKKGRSRNWLGSSSLNGWMQAMDFNTGCSSASVRDSFEQSK